MSEFGDSLCIMMMKLLKMHTKTSGDVFNYGQKYGELIKLKVENMREQHREVIRKEQDGLQSKELMNPKQLKQLLLQFL